MTKEKRNLMLDCLACLAAGMLVDFGTAWRIIAQKYNIVLEQKEIPIVHRYYDVYRRAEMHRQARKGA